MYMFSTKKCMYLNGTIDWYKVSLGTKSHCRSVIRFSKEHCYEIEYSNKKTEVIKRFLSVRYKNYTKQDENRPPWCIQSRENAILEDMENNRKILAAWSELWTRQWDSCCFQWKGRGSSTLMKGWSLGLGYKKQMKELDKLFYLKHFLIL